MAHKLMETANTRLSSEFQDPPIGALPGHPPLGDGNHSRLCSLVKGPTALVDCSAGQK